MPNSEAADCPRLLGEPAGLDGPQPAPQRRTARPHGCRTAAAQAPRRAQHAERTPADAAARRSRRQPTRHHPPAAGRRRRPERLGRQRAHTADERLCARQPRPGAATGSPRRLGSPVRQLARLGVALAVLKPAASRVRLPGLAAAH
ncbi:hypothetical protein FJT64_016962 [Amphibalanus amphitrite]|uniref:Uncharacterized protein n=1 Tax=Amphibalanus amphitrite TaxID=1232801 RepID=A0A6A4WYQ3_AMPAM|nr:hypothetical protein FJT64_016962 [Amphibalanus amphitrite]